MPARRRRSPSGSAACASRITIRGCSAPGVIVGLAILAKLNGVVLVPGLALVVLFRAAQSETETRWKRGQRLALGASAALILVCGWWFARNLWEYGDPSGSRDAIRFYAARFEALDPGRLADWSRFLRNTWESFWGRFGWMMFGLPVWIYPPIGLATLLLVSLSAMAAARRLARGPVSRPVWQMIGVMTVVAAGLTVSYIRFSFTVAFQAQGRYLFTVLLPIALVLTGGLHALAKGQKPRLRLVLLVAPFVCLAGLNVIGLLKVVQAARLAKPAHPIVTDAPRPQWVTPEASSRPVLPRPSGGSRVPGTGT